MDEEQDAQRIQDLCEDSTEAVNESLARALSTLRPREQKVLILRFGLEDTRVHTLEEIGYSLDLTRERIRQIEGRALRKLSQPARIKMLAELFGP